MSSADKNSRSFSAANVDLPVKVIKNRGFADLAARGTIIPAHIQWIPTNRCDADCSFCSCANRDTSHELNMQDSRAAIEEFAGLGTRAVTITGGGEPMLYRNMPDLIETFIENGIEVGLVTNGRRWKKWDYDAVRRARWLRMSISDEYPFDGFDSQIAEMSAKLQAVDFALSYVVTGAIDYRKIREAIRLVNMFRLAHIRIVFDICNADGVPANFMENLGGLDMSRVIVQPRQRFTRGVRDCWISLAKPVIGADGNIYPCCGVQYAAETQTLDLSSEFAMGTIKDVSEIWAHQRHFNGSVCAKCYYGGYNSTLDTMRAPVRHLAFI